jgi:hypothetical protein
MGDNEMKGSYCYLPILKARSGAFNALRTVSPTARARIAPLFDVLPPDPKQAKDPQAYLTKKVQGIVGCWAPDRPVYLDAHAFPLDALIGGMPPVAVVARGLAARGFQAVPVVGTESERGREYIAAIRRLAVDLGTGVCVRVEREELGEPMAFAASLSQTLDLLGVSAHMVDLVLDMDYVGKQSTPEVSSTAREALQAATSIGDFRNTVLVGGSVPEQLPKRDTGVVRREARIELEAWQQIVSLVDLPVPFAFGDFGVINPKYVKPGRPVNVPARVRYTTSREHIFLRTGRGGHGDLCRQLLAMQDEYAGAAYSAGDQRMDLAAQGLASVGNPSIWIAGDLNHHLELVSDQVWRLIQASGMSRLFALPEPRRYPWLQPVLAES